MREVHTEVPYPKRCEFCSSQLGLAILHADNQVAPTFSVRACDHCFNRLIHGAKLPDIFGWMWHITLEGEIVAVIASPKGGPLMSTEPSGPKSIDDRAWWARVCTLDGELQVSFIVDAYNAGEITDVQLWETLSSYHGPVSSAQAHMIYSKLGYVPFAGYPLERITSKRGSP